MMALDELLARIARIQQKKTRLARHMGAGYDPDLWAAFVALDRLQETVIDEADALRGLDLAGIRGTAAAE